MLIEMYDAETRVPFHLDDMWIAEQMVLRTSETGRFQIVSVDGEPIAEAGAEQKR